MTVKGKINISDIIKLTEGGGKDLYDWVSDRGGGSEP